MATREIVQLRDKETGDISELRDKALKEAAKSSTPSDATNNSVIPLETENGETIKIKAESLMKAFATMINSNSKSTITTLFGALSADNNTEFGAINMANLASVLGGLQQKYQINNVLDEAETYAAYSLGPDGNIGNLVSIKVNRNNGSNIGCMQFWVRYDDGEFYVRNRINREWKGWHRVY